MDQRRDELHDSIAERWIREITEILPGHKKLKILDVGCGTGYFSILLSKLGHQVTGIDLTPDMIEKGKLLAEEEHASCELVVMDAEQLQFADDSFDVVISRNLTWTLPHPEKAYKEWLRVLKKGGILLNFDADYGLEDSTDTSHLPKHHAHHLLGQSMLLENNEIKKNFKSVITDDHTMIFLCWQVSVWRNFIWIWVSVKEFILRRMISIIRLHCSNYV